MQRKRVLFIIAIICLAIVSVSSSSASLSTATNVFNAKVEIPKVEASELKKTVNNRFLSRKEENLSNEFTSTTAVDSNMVEDISTDTHSTSFVAECAMPTLLGNFRMRSYTYSSPRVYLEPIVITSGDIRGKDNVIVRVHDQCFTSEVFGSLRCDCRDQLQESLKLIKKEGGIVIYLQQEGRGIGIANKVAAYKLQDEGLDTVDANIHLGFRDEMREYLCVPDILADLGIKSIQLITNNPYKIEQLKQLGVNINKRLGLVIPSNYHNRKYLKSKRERMHHYMPVDDESQQQHDPHVMRASSVAAAMPDPDLIEEFKPKNDKGFKNLPKGTIPRADLSNRYALGKDTVLAAIEAIARGEVVIVVDDENRENEGDLIMAAEKATPEKIGYIVRHTSGVICVSLESDRLNDLKLPPMVINNEDPKQTAYTVSVDYKHGTTTGISAADRAACFRALVDPTKTHEDFQRPGHVFPLRYKTGGVIARGGHTEASLDLCKLAGLRPGGVLAEVVNDDGSMKRLPELVEMAKEHNLVLTSVQDITAYRLELLEKNSQ